MDTVSFVLMRAGARRAARTIHSQGHTVVLKGSRKASYPREARALSRIHRRGESAFTRNNRSNVVRNVFPDLTSSANGKVPL
jgi:hypothetical protein